MWENSFDQSFKFQWFKAFSQCQTSLEVQHFNLFVILNPLNGSYHSLKTSDLEFLFWHRLMLLDAWRSTRQVGDEEIEITFSETTELY